MHDLHFWLFFFAIIKPLLIGMALGQQDVLETLRIAFEADFADFVKQVDDQLDDTKDKFKETGDAADETGKRFGLLNGIKLGGAIAAGTMLLNVILKIAAAIPSIAINLAQGAVAVNAQFETFETQFTTLLGSTDAAQKRLEELSRFGVETPFELPEVVEASRLLQTFGGDALAATENLRMVGDLAAGVNQPIQSLAFWIGRMYSALQGGQPFGEAAMRLQEMGVLTPELRQEMERLQKAGADGNEIWAEFSETAGGKFQGNMERLSKTFQGVMSNLADFQGFLLRVGGLPFFEAIRDSAIEFLDVLNENEAQLLEIATAIGEIGAMIVTEIRDNFGEALDPKQIIDSIQGAVSGTMEMLRSVKAINDQLGQAIDLWDEIKTSLDVINKFSFFKEAEEDTATFNERLAGLAMGLAIVKASLAAVQAAIEPFIKRLGRVAEVGMLLFQGDVKGAFEVSKQALKENEDGILDLEAANQAWRDSILQSAADIDEALNGTTKKAEETTEAIETMTESTSEAAARPFEEAAKVIDSFSTQMIEAARNRDRELEKATQEHGENRLKIISDFEEERAKIIMESEEKANDAIAEAQEALADLEADTNKEIASRRDEFNREELRETEDHLEEMRRIEDRFLLDLKDAVADRDAVAIVKLRERHALEQSEKEAAFSKQQGRDREDADRELADIREKEAEKRAAINESLTEQLLEISEGEEEKLRLQEEKFNEQMVANDERFAAQQEQIEAALARQLETMARNLADQKDISEEGARAVLETFNEVFGIDGDIDKMMEDFVKRRELRATISLDFESRRGEALAASSQVSQEAAALGGLLGNILGTGGTTGMGIRPFAEGGSMFATKPTLALFGEKEPEFAQFIPMSQLSSGGGSESTGRFQLDITGSAPPGLGTSEVDRVASIVLMALREAGVLTGRGG